MNLELSKLVYEKTRLITGSHSEVVDWLYTNRGIWISVYIMERSNDRSIFFDYDIKIKGSEFGLINVSKPLQEFKTPEAAYCNAIKNTLMNLSK